MSVAQLERGWKQAEGLRIRLNENSTCLDMQKKVSRIATSEI